jgi:peptidyl-prolyl cis-trans isomerase SurA
MVMLLGLGSYATSVQASAIGIVAIVNDTVITSMDVTERAKLLIATGDGQISKDKLAQSAGKALKMLVNEALQLQEARRLSIAVSEDEIVSAIGNIEKSRKQPEGSLLSFMRTQNIAESTITNQVQAQIAWNKVVTERLRRKIIISDDEILRAQTSEIHAPGAVHYHIAALSIATKDGEVEAAELAETLLQDLSHGATFASVARKMAGTKAVSVQPSIWVAQDNLEPAIAAALRGMQPGQITKPLRSQGSYQIVQYRARKNIKPLPPSTEIILKDTLLPIAKDADEASFITLLSSANLLREKGNICSKDALQILPQALQETAESRFMFGKLAKLAPQLVPLIATLDVGETSEPVATPQGLRLVTLCEKIVPAVSVGDREQTRQKLFNAKIELEAAKTLRNLRRDAFIEIKSPTNLVANNLVSS